jgi:hypothetical protein
LDRPPPWPLWKTTCARPPRRTYVHGC